MRTVLEASASEAELTRRMACRGFDLAALVVVPKDEHSIVEFHVFCQCDAAFSTCENLLALQRLGRPVIESSDSFAVNFSTVCM